MVSKMMHKDAGKKEVKELEKAEDKKEAMKEIEKE